MGWIVEPRYLLEIVGANIDCASMHEPALRREYAQARSYGARQISCTRARDFVAGDCDADRRDLRARRGAQVRPIGKQLELFCYRLEPLTWFGIDPCQRKGAILLSKGQIVACSLPGGVILGADGALDEEGKRFAVLRRINQDVTALFSRIPDRYDAVESRWLVEIGDHLAVGGVGLRPLASRTRLVSGSALPCAGSGRS